MKRPFDPFLRPFGSKRQSRARQAQGLKGKKVKR